MSDGGEDRGGGGDPRKAQASKAEAMAACDVLHRRLLRCYDAGGDWCRAESKDFWDCYQMEKGGKGVRFDFTRLFGVSSTQKK
jgi:hypothetical protein